MEVERVDDGIARVVPFESEVRVGSGQHDYLGAHIHHPAARVEEGGAGVFRAGAGDGDVLIDLAEPLDVVVECHGADA